MENNKTSAIMISDLRQRAEDLVRQRPEDVTKISGYDIQRLVHELQVHQIELEMQNEQLNKAQEEVEELLDKYFDLYELAPIGYFTLDRQGLILEANLAGANLLGEQMRHLLKLGLSRFVSEDSQEKFYFHLRGVVETQTKQSCELRLVKKNGEQFYVQLVSVPAQDDQSNPASIRTTMSDITERKRTEEKLREAHDDLDRRVEERTAELVQLNSHLNLEIDERKKAEREVKERKAQLEAKTQELEEANSALRVLLQRVAADREELEEKVLVNVKELTLPYLEKLKNTPLSAHQKTCINILESNLTDIVSPFAHKLSSRYLNLTHTEIHVANLVKEGNRTKDIAQILGLSVRTVEVHRQSIRNKLGLKNRKANLRSHLLSLR
jgi:PAS domain S-box-containing protein